jgi:hypothetical protein
MIVMPRPRMRERCQIANVTEGNPDEHLTVEWTTRL